MSYPISGPEADRRISASVKWYDPARGFGFLLPGDGSADIFCREPALEAVGLETLLAGATVDCETVQTPRGPEVSRIHAVDFSMASPRLASSGRAPAGRPAMSGPGSDTSGRRVRAVVKWYDPVKGYGFLEPEDGSADLFCHLTVVQASNHDTLVEGQPAVCEIVQGEKGPQVSRLVSIEPPPAGAGAADRVRPLRDLPDIYAGAAAPAAGMSLPGTVKFYDPAKGFGFVVPDDGGREVFVHASVLLRSGMEDLLAGQRVVVHAESVPRGLQATDIEPL